jgi:hypothetical protein
MAYPMMLLVSFLQDRHATSIRAASQLTTVLSIAVDCKSTIL